MTQPSAILWTHAIAALLFAVLALTQMRRPADGLPRRAFTAALTLTALWALAVAGLDGRDVAIRIVEGLRNLAWLTFMWALARHVPRGGMVHAYVVIAWTMAAGMALTLFGEAHGIGVGGIGSIGGVGGGGGGGGVGGIGGVGVGVRGVGGGLGGLGGGGGGLTPVAEIRVVLRMVADVGALWLVHRLWSERGAGGGVAIVALALAAFWLIDLTMFAAAYLTGAWPQSLAAVRGAAVAALVPPFWLAMQRRDAPTLQLSRTIAIQCFAALGVGFYIVFTGVAAGFFAGFGGDYARLIQTAFVFGSAAALLTIASTPWLRSWTKVLVAKHLFRHRYDYRAEWLRFTGTIGGPDSGAATLGTRVVKAMADLVDAPAGLLLVPDGVSGGLGLSLAATWGETDEAVPPNEDLAGLATYLLATHRTLELDAIRAGRASAADAAATPDWILRRAAPWVIVPLIHFNRLAGVVLLDRPPIERALDWEDFDLFGVAARQAASYLAEDRADTALAAARRFDEFNRRFAFILHDLKNLVSQQTLVARNAERHADNPAFRADMVATLRESAERMTTLLARLTQSPVPRGEDVRAAALWPIAQRVADARRAQHPVHVSGDQSVVAHVAPAVLEVLLTHLVQNAIEASAPDTPVGLIIGREDRRATITVVDGGCGMTNAFVRDQLFRPFVSSKPGGFGIGAFEARQLAEAMGGTIGVTTREGEGSRFAVALPLADALPDMEQAA